MCCFGGDWKVGGEYLFTGVTSLDDDELVGGEYLLIGVASFGDDG